MMILLLADLALGQAPFSATAGGTGGNPFTAPAQKVNSLFDYRTLSNVSDSLQEFLELNDSLPGSVKPVQLSADAARRALRALLAGENNRAFFRFVATAPRLQSVDGLNAAAVSCFARGRNAEAFACLLLAAEKAPQDPAVLLNLASAALVLRRANEALALVAEAEKGGALPAGAWDMAGPRLADYLRGYAFMLRGEYAAARPLLVRVVEAEPNLKEAALTLALVEAKLGENPRKSFLLGVWRQRGKLLVCDTRTPTTVEEARREPDALAEGESISPSMTSLFDVTRGAPGRLPPLKRPRTPADLMSMSKDYTGSMLECMSAAANLHNNVAGSALTAFDAAKPPAAYKNRMLSLYNRATLRIGAVAELDQAARETDVLRTQLDALTESEVEVARVAREPIQRRQFEFNNRPGFQLTEAELRRQYAELNATTQVALERTSRLVEKYHQALEREFTLRSSYMHGMLGHIGAPALRAALLAEAEVVRFEMQVAQLSAVINLANAIGAPTDDGTVKPEAGEAGKGPPCSDENSKWSMTADLEIFSVELTCNSVSLEVEKDVIPEVLTLSGELSLETNGTVSIFAGPKASLLGVGSAKGGAYVSVGREGVRDIGVKAELKASAPVGALPLSYKVAESKVSFLPAPDPGPPPGALPVFGGSQR